jgi:hypothetical protein
LQQRSRHGFKQDKALEKGVKRVRVEAVIEVDALSARLPPGASLEDAGKDRRRLLEERASDVKFLSSDVKLLPSESFDRALDNHRIRSLCLVGRRNKELDSARRKVGHVKGRGGTPEA